MTIPYTFAGATTAIPLAQLDANFASPITLGNVAMTLSNTYTSIGNLTLTNVTVSSGNVAVTNANVTTLTATNDASISGLTVGKGGGAVSTNTAFGTSALGSNTTGANTTAIGYQAGYSNSTGNSNTFMGYQAGYNSTGTYNTIIGVTAGKELTTGNKNIFIGGSNGVTGGAGQSITTGSSNVILGCYTGNNGGIDIRTASNYIVLSDGDGNPRGVFDGNGKFLIGMTSYSAFANGVAIYSDANGAVLNLGHTTGSGNGAGFVLFGYNNGGIGSITQNGTTAVLYNTTSDYRLKNNVASIQNALATVEALNPVSFTWVDGRPDDGFLAHEIQAIIPNCVTGEKDAVNEDGTPKYQQMDNSGVIPFLVKAIQEQQALITDLQARLTKAGL